MQVNRRGFLKLSGATAVTVTLGELGFDLAPVRAQTKRNQNFTRSSVSYHLPLL